jgi:hypothetical protein
MSKITDPNWNPRADYDPEKVPYVVVTVTVTDLETGEVLSQDTYDQDESEFRDPDDFDQDAIVSLSGMDPLEFDSEQHEVTWTIERVDPNADVNN